MFPDRKVHYIIQKMLSTILGQTIPVYTLAPCVLKVPFSFITHLLLGLYKLSLTFRLHSSNFVHSVHVPARVTCPTIPIPHLIALRHGISHVSLFLASLKVINIFSPVKLQVRK